MKGRIPSVLRKLTGFDRPMTRQSELTSIRRLLLTLLDSPSQRPNPSAVDPEQIVASWGDVTAVLVTGKELPVRVA